MLQLGGRFGFEIVELRKLLPRVAIEAVFEVIDVGHVGLLVGLGDALSKFFFDRRDGRLRRVQFLLVSLLFRLELSPRGIVLEDRSLDVRVWVAVRRDPLEESEHRVVIALRDRVDFVIVAAGAVHRQSEKRLAGGRDDVVETFVQREQPVGRLIVPQAEPVKAGGDDRVARHGRQFVSGQLLADELIVRFVAVERADHVVAVTPRIGLGTVTFKAVGVGVTDHIQPVPRPLLAVVLRLKEPVHDLFIGGW